MARGSGVVLAVLIPGGAHAQSHGDFTSPRNAVVSAAGARLIKVEAGAGFLHINGCTGSSQVRVDGVASASSRSRILKPLSPIYFPDIARIRLPSSPPSSQITIPPSLRSRTYRTFSPTDWGSS